MTIVAYQGEPGAYMEAAALVLFPAGTPLPCATFDAAFEALKTGKADRAVIAVENRIAGRVADVHKLLPNSGLYIVGEYFHPIEHQLLALPTARLEDIKEALSHEQALAQCHGYLTAHNIKPVDWGDTAGGAAEIARRGDKTAAAIASKRAGELYGLVSLASDIADTKRNMTRFLVLSRDADVPTPAIPCITTLVFELRSVPAALYKALGGFATNGINITKIESYLSPADFTSARFYIDIEAHPETESCQHALDELHFFTTRVDILGTYPANRPAA